LETVYQADPTDDPKLNLYGWVLENASPTRVICDLLLGSPDITGISGNAFAFFFAEGIVFLPNFSAIHLNAVNELHSEEHAFLLTIRGITCWLACYMESIA
jgi:hypothetical protein